MLDLSICIIVFIVGVSIKNWSKVFDRYDKTILNMLFLFHIFIGIIYYYYVLKNGGDAYVYWLIPSENSYADIIDKIARGSSTTNIYLINYIPAHTLSLSFFTLSMMYVLFGYMGFVLVYKTIKENIPDIAALRRFRVFGIPVFPYILFLPNLHFWTSGVGKDTIVFFCIALFIYSLKNYSKRIAGLIIAILLSFIIRPHITLFLMVSFGLGLVLDKELKGYKKMLLSLVFLAALALMIETVLNFVQLESLEVGAIEQYSSSKAESLSTEAGSGVDISEYPFPLKVFTFLFRPLFFDINNALAIVASFENLFLIFFMIKILRNRPGNAFKKGNRLIKGIFIFFVLGTIAFSMILGNLGIMLRQKAPFIVVFIIFGYWVLSLNSILKSKTKNSLNHSNS